MKHIFFDLDGTVVDSSEGILAAFRYAFEEMGLPSPDQAILETFIGPPLEVSFADFGDDDWVQKAITSFRTYYREKGVFQVEVYKGLTEHLTDLKQIGYPLYITTSKNHEMALKMLEYLEVDSYFTAVYGALPDSYNKADVIRRAIAENQLALQDCAIVGDTKFDMIGGKEVGIETIGVLWGFGKQDELLENGADHLISQPQELVKLLEQRK